MMFDKIDTLMKNLKLLLSSLISNHSCVEGGRKKPWFFAVPMFLIAMILALIPPFVQTITKQGDSSISSVSYEMDEALLAFSKTLNDNGIEMTVSSDKRLVITAGSFDTIATNTDDFEHKCYTHSYWNDKASEYQPDLDIYYVADINLVDDTYFKMNVTTESGTSKANRTRSVLLFTNESVSFYIYSIPKGAAVASIYGDYQSFEEGYKVNQIYKGTKANTWTEWKSFFRVAYDANRVKTTWMTTGILAGINFAITVFMGLMLWVLTRGKNNLNWFGLWETQKIAYWASISPAILAVGLGFLLTSFAQVVYPMLLGVRVMWLSMKLLRPENADLYPSLKQEKAVKVKAVK